MGSLWHLAAGLATDAPQRIVRIAVVAASEHMPNARFFALAAQNRSLDARAFESYDEAVRWLMDAGDGEGQASAAAH